MKIGAIIDIFQDHYAIYRQNILKEQLKFCGTNSGFGDRYFIKKPAYISVGDNFSALYGLRLEAIDSYAQEKFNPSISIGNNVSMNADCHIGCIGTVTIEDNVLLGSKVFITDHFHGNSDFESLIVPPVQRGLFTKGAILIGKNSWLGEGVVVMPGVTIGESVIIGANSVVTKSIPSFSIAAGIPCKVIKSYNS